MAQAWAPGTPGQVDASFTLTGTDLRHDQDQEQETGYSSHFMLFLSVPAVTVQALPDGNMASESPQVAIGILAP